MKAKYNGVIYQVFCFSPDKVCLLINGKQTWLYNELVEVIY